MEVSTPHFDRAGGVGATLLLLLGRRRRRRRHSPRRLSLGTRRRAGGAGQDDRRLFLMHLAGNPPAGRRLSSILGTGSRCEKACNPQMGNLAHGRKLWTDTTCGYNFTELYCSYSENTDFLCKWPKCSKCNSMNTHLAHPSSAMVDSSFRLPHTWWQSAQGVQTEKIQLNLETEFYFTHLIMIFKSPRPAAMVLERSQDFGKTWKPYKYFSINCSAIFRLDDDVTKKEALCTSRYSSHFPCTGGEVIYRALSPPNSADDPYNPKIQAQLKITNLRVQLLKRQSCPCHSNDLNANPPQLTYYAVYDFIVKGSCFCNGHADRCAPIKGFRPVKAAGVFHVLHGRCICKHNTAGTHCQYCAPLYNDQPWHAANGQTGAPNGCKSCKCNGHSDTCHFDMDTWLASGNQSGGLCDNCQHNTEGQHCERCKPGYYRDLRKVFSAPDTCKLCSCNPIGSAVLPFSNSTFCDPNNGDCPCKPGVAGPQCDRCMVGYWGFGYYGCQPCDCAGSCDSINGDCINSNADIEWYHEIPGLYSARNKSEAAWQWEEEQGYSALRHSVVKAKILSAHDKGSHAEVNVMIQKVLKSTKLKIFHGKQILYPESWTTRGCTCPILNPGLKYLVAGYEDIHTSRLIVNMKSIVHQWKSALGKKILQIFKKCG
ncbi:netrin-4 isoform X2 [Crotalus tigris]|uniref:netrin-4 isoform X2 n=1 Tax=Crotalus tigris TaxID=88082 RepID=UPI00192F39EC|nr:netrin-4 isoform X2 [Crotalus tigris]